MGFMSGQVVFGDWFVVETKNGTEIVDADLFTHPETVVKAQLVDFCEGDIESFELKRQKYGARLSANGFMDRTDWTIHDSAEEAVKYLEETYPEDDEDDE